MKIDWFTVIAQIINFLILVWLLKKFLYKPVLQAIREREKKIKDQLQDAAGMNAAATAEQRNFKKKIEDLDQQKSQLMEKAVLEAGAERKKLIEAANSEVIALQQEREKAFREQQEKQRLTLEEKISEQVFRITQKAFTELGAPELENQLLDSFCVHLGVLADKDKNIFREASRTSAAKIRVNSAYKLSPERVEKLTATLTGILGTRPFLELEVVPQLISGIELIAGGYKLAWNFSAYLEDLEKHISQRRNQDAPVLQPSV